jgi:hypothetical protein
VSHVHIYNNHVQDSKPNLNIVDIDRIDVTPSQATAPEQDDIDIADDDANKFSDDKESFILITVTPAFCIIKSSPS